VIRSKEAVAMVRSKGQKLDIKKPPMTPKEKREMLYCELCGQEGTPKSMDNRPCQPYHFDYADYNYYWWRTHYFSWLAPLGCVLHLSLFLLLQTQHMFRSLTRKQQKWGCCGKSLTTPGCSRYAHELKTRWQVWINFYTRRVICILLFCIVWFYLILGMIIFLRSVLYPLVLSVSQVLQEIWGFVSPNPTFKPLEVSQF